MYGVLASFYTFYFAVSHHFGQVRLQLLSALLLSNLYRVFDLIMYTIQKLNKELLKL